MRSIYLTIFFVLAFAAFAEAQEFVNPIQIPPLITQDDYHLNVIETAHNFNPNGSDSLNTMVRTFAFEDANNPGTTTILGPTLAWNYLHNLTPKVTNKLTEVTTCHWHGAHVPQFADGGPHQRIQAGETWDPFFTVLDKSATMWYHPHAMDLTYRHVQMGLSGMIYVEDPVDGLDDPILSAIHRFLPVDYGVNDFPLIFQTKKFIRDTATNDIIIKSDFGFKDGYYYMVNGIVDPVMRVPANMIRVRMLNGDGKFTFDFQFNNSDGSRFPAQMIATDAGYMTKTHQLDDILMSPGERTEWLLDLRGREGDTIYVHNNVDGLPPRTIGDRGTTRNYAQNRDLLRIIVGPNTVPPSPIIGFPVALHPTEQPALSEVTRERVKTFRKDTFIIEGDTMNLFNIDSTLMDMMVVNDVVKVDSTELWTIDNQTVHGHPWHIHDIHFWVTNIIDADGMPLDRNDYPELFDGPKDNVFVQPGWKLSYIATFSDFGTEVKFDSSYMFHCHILPHEDRGMMGQFVVWNGVGQGWPTAVDEPEVSNIRMDVYPNPARELLYLDGTTTRESELRFIDLNGRVIKALRLPAFDGAIELSADGLPSGMLIMDWQTHEGRAVRKVMINH